MKCNSKPEDWRSDERGSLGVRLWESRIFMIKCDMWQQREDWRLEHKQFYSHEKIISILPKMWTEELLQFPTDTRAIPWSYLKLGDLMPKYLQYILWLTLSASMSLWYSASQWRGNLANMLLSVTVWPFCWSSQSDTGSRLTSISTCWQNYTFISTYKSNTIYWLYPLLTYTSPLI